MGASQTGASAVVSNLSLSLLSLQSSFWGGRGIYFVSQGKHF